MTISRDNQNMISPIFMSTWYSCCRTGYAAHLGFLIVIYVEKESPFIWMMWIPGERLCKVQYLKIWSRLRLINISAGDNHLLFLCMGTFFNWTCHFKAFFPSCDLYRDISWSSVCLSACETFPEKSSPLGSNKKLECECWYFYFCLLADQIFHIIRHDYLQRQQSRL